MERDDIVQACTRRRMLGAAAFAWSAVVGFGVKDAAATKLDEIRQPDVASPEAFISRAFAMRDLAAELGDQAYGAIIVAPSGRIVGQAPSRVIVRQDPTAHAEMEAIRDATRRLGNRDLSGHVIYSSSRPCPMCEAAAFWANLSSMVHGGSGQEAGGPQLCR